MGENGSSNNVGGFVMIAIVVVLAIVMVVGFTLFRKKGRLSAKLKGPIGTGVEFEVSEEREQVERLSGKSKPLLDRSTTVNNYIERSRTLQNLEAELIYREEDFFELLETYASSARQRVDLTYFDNRPPDQVRTHRGKQYYNNLIGIIRRNPSVHFRRIVRANAAMLPWIASQIEDLKGQSNFSLAFYRELSPAGPEIDAITVQLIDDEFTFLVSLGTQRSSRTPRDIVVRSSIFNEMWTRYYDMLWSRSVVVLERGAICDSWEKLNQSLRTS